MNMNEYRAMAAKMDQHMQQLAQQGVGDPHQILARMLGYIPDLHKIWVGTSDQQLMALSRQFPGFYRFAVIMEEASEAERRKATRSYHNLPRFSDAHQQRMTVLLTNAATLEREYENVLDSGTELHSASLLNELNALRRNWLADIEHFQAMLKAEGTAPKVMDIVSEALQPLIERIAALDRRTHEEKV